MMLRLLSIRGCRFLLCSNAGIKRVTAARCMHIDTTSKYASRGRRFALHSYKHSIVTSTFVVRHASTSNVAEQPHLTQIPDPPKAVEQPGELLTFHANGEPTLESMGLGGWTSPTGIIESCLEWLHVTFGLPWFAAIAAGTLIARIILLPVMIKTHKCMAHMSYFTPKITEIQERFTDARRCGDYGKIVDATVEMNKLYDDPNFRPVLTALLPFVQMPVFLSMFFGLKQMAGVPVQSLKHGGIWWFTDLTVPDPYYILPCIACLTIYITLKLNTDMTLQQNKYMQYIPLIVPMVIFPFMISFPAALPCYWTTTNLFSLAQASILKTKIVKKYFDIPEIYEPPKQPEEFKSLVQNFKNSISNIKYSKRVNDKLHADEITFKNAGLGAVPKTYGYNPTMQRSSVNKFSKSNK